MATNNTNRAANNTNRAAANTNRAAAAKNNNNAGSNRENLVQFLFQLQVATKMFHWQTRAYANHAAAGDLYGKITDLTDELIEQYMGLYGRPRMPPKAAVYVPNMTRRDMADLLRQSIRFLESARVPPTLHNVRDELTGALAKSLYLLTLG